MMCLSPDLESLSNLFFTETREERIIPVRETKKCPKWN